MAQFERGKEQLASIDVLDIPHDYEFMKPQLIEQIRSGLDAVLGTNSSPDRSRIPSHPH